MKFFGTVLAFGLVATTFAEPIPASKRALSDFQAVITAVRTQVGVLDTTVTNYQGGTATADNVQTESDELVTIIENGDTTVQGLPTLSSIEALGLVSPIQALTGDVSDLVDNVIAAHGKFQAEGRDGEVLTSLQEQKTASEGLAASITSKVPSSLQGLANELSAGISENIQRGIDAYS